MDGVHVSYLSCADYRGNIEVALRQLRRANADGFVGKLDVQRVAVGLTVDRHGANPQFFAGTNYAQSNLAAVRYQNFIEHALNECGADTLVRFFEVNLHNVRNRKINGKRDEQECPPNTINFSDELQIIPGRIRLVGHSRPVFSQFHQLRPPRSRSSTSWLRQCKALARLRRYRQSLQMVASPGTGIRRTCLRLGNGRCAVQVPRPAGQRRSRCSRAMTVRVQPQTRKSPESRQTP